MKKIAYLLWLQRSIHWGICWSAASLLISCSYSDVPIGPTSLNSRYTETQATLSGNGRFLAFISNRAGSHQILLYDLQQQQFVSTPGLNKSQTIVESPGLSYTGRYIVYITSDRGRPVVGLYDRITQQSQILTPTYPGWIKNPNISPDGRYVAFETASRGQWDIEVLDRGPEIELDIPNGATMTLTP